MLDHDWWKRGLVIAGVDEAGRGALAGPVVAAAVVLDEQNIPQGIADSKTLSAARRMQLATDIRLSARAVGVGVVHCQEINRINILQATYTAMHDALDALGSCVPDFVLVDGNSFRPWTSPHTCITKGDARSLSIGAASIIAKTYRDEYMKTVLHPAYPVYGFDTHVGYGTELHRQMLLEHGPCAEHRELFIRKVLRR